jgi:pilus assembly protein FimV
LRANPEAFIDGNINNLKEGYVLRIPSRDELTSISRAAAVRESRAQYAAWRAARDQTPAGNVAAADEQRSTAANPASVTGEPSLQLVAPDASDAAAVGTPGGEDLSTLQKDLVMTNEALEEQRRQSEEMSSRLSMLEEQITNMQRLIQLKDNELARIQALSAGGADGTTATAATAGVTENPASGTDVPPEDGAKAAAATMGDEGVGADKPATDAIAPSTDGVADTAADTTEVADGQFPADTAAVAAAGPEDDGVATTGPTDIPADGTTDESGVTESGVAEQPAPVTAAAPETPFAVSPPEFVERLLANPLWLGGGAAVLALLAFFGLRRKRGVEAEFQESILEATQPGSGGTDDESVASHSEPVSGTATESSLLSEFAVSDMGSIRNDGEADPLAEADVYLAYGRYQQAEHLIRDALEKDGERDDLNLKLLEVFTATQDQAAFDEHAQGLLERLGSSNHPV